MRATDFELTVEGQPREHAVEFCDFPVTGRLGLVAPEGIEGAGAVVLILAYVTAFYDRYRARSENFFAYPDFFAFQERSRVVDYGMFDIWPSHKLVRVVPGLHGDANETRHDAMLRAVTDRGVQILLVPDQNFSQKTYQTVALASAQRCIQTCYAFDPAGQVADADLVVRCRRGADLVEWAKHVFASVELDGPMRRRADKWLADATGIEVLEQSYRRIDLDAALARL